MTDHTVYPNPNSSGGACAGLVGWSVGCVGGWVIDRLGGVCACACVRACVRVCVCVCVGGGGRGLTYNFLLTFASLEVSIADAAGVRAWSLAWIEG